jgi:DNA-binding transcriptional LysR family regulator
MRSSAMRGLTYLDHEPAGTCFPWRFMPNATCLSHAQARGLTGAVRSLGKTLLPQPLCLLHQGMQFRRILDSRVKAQGLAIAPRAVADSYVALFDMVRSGGFSTVVPDTYAHLLEGLEWARLLPFEGEAERRRIGLVVMNRAPLGPLASAGLAAARALALV